jgi:hypothetical protein
MNKLILLLMISVLFSFGQKNNINDGKYINSDKNDTYIYALEIKNDFKEISFYLFEDKSKIKDYKIICTAKIIQNKNKFYLKDIKCNDLPVTNNNKTELFIKEGSIQFKSYDLLKNFFHEFIIYANKMKFEKEI